MAVKEIVLRVTEFKKVKHSVRFKSAGGWSVYIKNDVLKDLGDPKKLDVIFRVVE